MDHIRPTCFVPEEGYGEETHNWPYKIVIVALAVLS